MRLPLLLCAAAALLPAQTPTPAAGLEPTWDIAVVLNEISANAARLAPALERLDASAWVAKGASETYVQQWQSSREQARALADGAKAAAKYPERLSAALELCFRMEALERMMTSIEEAARRYQNPEVSQALDAVYAEGGANRERFRRYVVNLAVDREHQFEVMDKEAQRCRGTLMASPPSTAPRTIGRKK